MIDIRFDACCESCPHIEVDYETVQSLLGETTTIIGCSHMCVCGRYHGGDPAEDAPPSGKGILRC